MKSRKDILEGVYAKHLNCQGQKEERERASFDLLLDIRELLQKLVDIDILGSS